MTPAQLNELRDKMKTIKAPKDDFSVAALITSITVDRCIDVLNKEFARFMEKCVTSQTPDVEAPSSPTTQSCALACVMAEVNKC